MKEHTKNERRYLTMNKWLEAGLLGICTGIVAGLPAVGVLKITKVIDTNKQETVKLEELTKNEGKR